MELFIFILVFVFGSAIGSFLNVLVDRLPRNESFLNSRSYCEKCKKKLGPFDLFPIFSFLFLRGRCRYCSAKIPRRLFLLEILTGTVFLYIFSLFAQNQFTLPAFVFYLILASSLIVIFFADSLHGIIPDEINVLLFVSAFIYKYFYEGNLLLSMFSGLALFVFFLGLLLITKGKGMGMGDVKLSFVVGFVLGFPQSIVACYLAFLTGGAISTILILWGKKKLRGDTIPFGPFLVAGGVLSYLLTTPLLSFLGVH